MYSSNKIKAAGAALSVAFLFAVAFASTAGAGNGRPFGMTPQQWKAEQVRGDALNRYYRLGRYSTASTQQDAARAETVRGEALNRYYHLGRYAVVEASSSFQWSAAGIGAGAMLGAIILVGGSAVAIRRRSVGKTSPLTTT